MKKFFVVTSVLLMCCMFMGCGVKAKLDGTWKANKSGSRQEGLEATIETDSYPGYKTTVSVVATSEHNITLTINKDGTFSQEVVATQTSVVEDYFYDYYPEGTKITVLSDGNTYQKMYGNWYYDNDKIVLKITHLEQQFGDDEKEFYDNTTYLSEELYLIDDILFAEIETEILEGIYEFTKAE
ncbi:MAG: hypothetical protein J6K22_03975 [Spirochaetaceae bacterium]|nr:hypothetical protein [Spirochaetaceae bacterium]